MPNKLSIVQCATAGCHNTFATWSKDFDLYCPDCRIASIRTSGPRFEEPEPPEDIDRFHDPDYLLQQEFIALNSIFKHNQTGHCHRVVRDARGRLALDPPYEQT